jgi:hypothetical protein
MLSWDAWEGGAGQAAETADDEIEFLIIRGAQGP